MKKTSLIIAISLLVLNATAQLSKNSELYNTLRQQDSIFFERSFNLCDLEYLEKAIHKDLVFFHDQGGIQDRTKFFDNIRKYICGNTEQKPIRKVETNSLEVYPLYTDGKLYGAIQTGIHNFYRREKGKTDVHTNRAKFTHVWLLENGKWLLREVLSFDHQEPARIDSATTAFLTPPTVSVPRGYSHAAKVDMGTTTMIILSGQVPLDSKGNLVGKDDR